MERYVYRPLLQEPQSIRLLQIEPGAEGSEIHCLVFDYTIQQDCVSGPYEALSYVWGDSAERQRIYLKDAGSENTAKEAVAYLDVTTNLYVAMNRLRDPVFPRLIWIDAVCINQMNLQERAMQVKFMATIYSCASRVVVWLGEEADNSGEALDELEKVAAESQWRNVMDEDAPSSRNTIDGASGYGDTSSSSSGIEAALWSESETSSATENITLRPLRRGITVAAWPSHDKALPSPLKDTPSLSSASLVALLSRPWFNRIWILQEAAAARHLLIICGKSEITGTTFEQGMSNFPYRKGISLCRRAASVTRLMAWNPPNMLFRPKDRRRSNRLGVMALPELLDHFHTREATNRRDKIFALLGMCHNADESTDFPEPDYMKTWSAIFRETTNHLFGSSVKVRTWDDRELAVFTCQGHPLGTVRKLERTGTFEIICTQPTGFLVKSNTLRQDLRRTIKPIPFEAGSYSKDIREHDILWQIAGERYPCIIRFCADHFDVIVSSFKVERIYLDLFPFSRRNSSTEIPWLKFTHCLVAQQRPITLAWDWASDSPQIHENHRLALADGGDHISPSTRLLDCARIFDDLCDRKGLQGLVKSLSEHTYDKEDTKYIGLLAMASTYWTSYLWLKDFIEELRWCIVRLKNSQSFYPENPSCMLEYWRSEGTLRFNAMDIAALSDGAAPQISTASSADDQLCSDDLRWDFGQASHVNLLTKFFPNNTDTMKLYEPKDMEIQDNNATTWSSRHIFHLIGARYDMNRLSSSSSTESLLSSNFHPGTRSASNPIPRSILLFFALNSSLRAPSFCLTQATLMSKIYKREASRLFSFLLAEACTDVHSAYNILAAAAHMYKMWDFIETPSYAYAAWGLEEHSGPIFGVTGGSWFLNNLRVIKYCVEHTALCEVALAHHDDAVLPALVQLFRHRAGFKMDVTGDANEMRRLVLMGIQDCLDGRCKTGIVRTRSTRRTSVVQRDVITVGREYESDEEEKNIELVRRAERERMRHRVSLKKSVEFSDAESENSPAYESH